MMRTKAEIDPIILERLLSVIAVGAGRGVACAQAGISDETFRKYERLGQKAAEKREKKKGKMTAKDELFASFYDRLRRAETNTEAYMLGLLQKAAGGDWRAGAWLLEKLYPKRYGSRVDLTHSGATEVKRDLSKLTVEELFQLRNITKKIEGTDDE